MTRSRTRNVLAVLAVIALGLVAAGCGGDDEKAATTAAPAATTETATTATAGPIAVEASEMKFVLSSATAPAGAVTFDATNVGKVDHEMVVIKTETPAGELPVKDGEVDETGALGEIGPEDLKPGANKSLTLDLDAGRYALICALPGHYEAGMYSDFEVQ